MDESGSTDDLSCGARSLACCNYQDLTSYERDGLRLFWQACICPAAVLAANASLLAGEKATPQAHNIPCTRSQRTRSVPANMSIAADLRTDMYGLAHSVYGKPNPTPENTLKQTAPEQPPVDTDCHGPLRLGLLAVRRNIAASGCRFELGASQPGSQGQSITPVTGCTSAAATVGGALDTGADDTKDSSKSAAARRHFLREPSAMSRVGPAAASTAVYGGGGGGSATAGSVHGGGGSAVADGSCVGETSVATPLGGRADGGSRVKAGVVNEPPRSSGSSNGGDAKSQELAPCESIPPPEVTDSPRMGLAAAVVTAGSYVASTASLQDGDSVLDSGAFLGPVQPPVVAPLRPLPPRFEAPPKLQPPPSKDSEVGAARAQGPKVTGTSQAQQRSAAGSRSHLSDQSSVFHSGRSRPRASAAQPTMSDSESSTFSLPHEPSPSLQPALNTSSKRTGTAVPTTSSSGAAPPSAKSNTSFSHTVIAVAAVPAITLTVTVPPTPQPAPSSTPSSNDMRRTHDTITSSKLSAMIDHAMLNGSDGSGASGARGSGGTAGSGETAVPWDSCRHSVMAPIAEAEVEEYPRSSGQQRAVMPSSEACGADASAVLEPGVPLPRGLPASACANVSSRKAQRASRGSGGQGGVAGTGGSLAAMATTNLRAGVSVSRTSGGQGGAVSGVAAGGLNGAALTVLARMGADCSGHSSSGGAGPSGSIGQQRAASNAPMRSGNNPRHQGNASLQRRTLAASSTKAIPPAATRSASSSHGNSPSSAATTSTSKTASGPRMTAATATCTDSEAQRHPAPGGAPQSTAAPYTAGLTYISDDADDAVNMASIVPSLVDGPEMGSVREALRCAGEQADALAVGVHPSDSSRRLPSSTCPAPTLAAAAVVQSGSSTTPSTQRLLTRPLAPAMIAGGLPRIAGGGGRYGGQVVSSATAAAASTAALPALAVPAAAAELDQYASYCEEGGGPWHNDAGCSGEGEEDASSIIDGPVSSGEQEGGPSGVRTHHMKEVSQEAVSRPVLRSGARIHARAPYEPGSPEGADEEADRGDDGDGYVDCCDEEEDEGISGDACVSVMLTGFGGGPTSGGPVPSGDAAARESSATGGGSQLAGRSISGLSNGGSAGGCYGVGGGDGAASVGDSVAASQHRQKHWINWMAQSVVSVGMSYATSSRTMQQMPYRPAVKGGLSGGGGAGSGPVTGRVTGVGLTRGGRGLGSADQRSGGGGEVLYEPWG